jgi:ATP-dependent Clp protease adapter protein ClpS
MTEKEREIVINNEDDYASFSYVFEIIENIIEEREHSAEENVEDDGI